MSSHLVSVIMPVYNTGQYVEEAIKSVLNQSYENWELLIINDGSTDSSHRIINSFTDQRIKYFKQENRGVSAARNIGLEVMKGEYFCFLDADDFFTPNSIQSRVFIFSANSEVNFVDGKVLIFNTSSKKTIREYVPNFEGNPYNQLLSISSSCFFGITWMIRRVPEKVYKFKDGLTHAEDLLFYISISKEGNYRYTKETIYKCRADNQSAMSNLKQLEKGYFDVYDEILYHYSKSKKFKKRIKSIMFRSYLSKFHVISALKILLR